MKRSFFQAPILLYWFTTWTILLYWFTTWTILLYWFTTWTILLYWFTTWTILLYWFTTWTILLYWFTTWTILLYWFTTWTILLYWFTTWTILLYWFTTWTILLYWFTTWTILLYWFTTWTILLYWFTTWTILLYWFTTWTILLYWFTTWTILLYWFTTWTLTKRLKKKLDGNYTRMLRAILNKSWWQHPTRHHLYGRLSPITKTIQVRRTRHEGHCWRSKDELISDVLLWTPAFGQAKAGRPDRTYIQQPCEDTGYNPEDLTKAMNDREKWRDRLRDMHAGGMIWWWWFEIYFWVKQFLKMRRTFSDLATMMHQTKNVLSQSITCFKL